VVRKTFNAIRKKEQGEGGKPKALRAFYRNTVQQVIIKGKSKWERKLGSAAWGRLQEASGINKTGRGGRGARGWIMMYDRGVRSQKTQL